MKRICFLLLAIFLIGCGGGGGGSDATNGSTPIATTLAPTSITPTSATLNGAVIPNGLQTQSWFEYGIDPGLATYTSSPRQESGSGLTSQTVNTTWIYLEAGTTYFFRFCSENSKGYSKGQIVSLTTSSPGDPPTVATLSATSIGAATATLNGNVIANGVATTVWFEYGTNPSLAIYTCTSLQTVAAGTTSVPVDAPLTGLAIGTTYYYRIVASNNSGTTNGSIQSFVPGAAPTVTTLAATPVGADTATLNGSVAANGLATTAWFEWGPDPDLPTYTSTSTLSVGSGTISVSADAALTGLAAGTTYYYRIAATNGSGTTRGGILSFVPGAAPTVSTFNATQVGANTATLNGNAAANGFSTTVWFEWGPNPDLSIYTSTSPQSIGSGTTIVPVYAALTGLVNGTAYYCRIAAANSSGTTRGTILGFNTDSEPAGWSITGSMGTPRAGHTATLLANGNVLVAGGRASFSKLSSAELYHPGIGFFESTGSMGAARSSHTATLLANGKVLIAGGGVASAELYDPETESFAPTGSPGITVSTATLLQNGKVLATGGGNAELYNPGTGTFSPTGSPGIAISTATLLPNGKVLITGGGAAELYDPGTGTFSPTGSMGIARSSHAATLLADGKVLVSGGMDDLDSTPLSSAELYDPATGTFTPTGSMGTTRFWHTAALLSDGEVLVAGGYDQYDGTRSSAELYDPETGTFTPTESMGIVRRGHTATLLVDSYSGRDTVLVTGGSNEWENLSVSELYDPGI